MTRVPTKREMGLLDGTPDKRMYWSIISDYDIPTGVCELVDNAIDSWMNNPSRGALKIDLVLDAVRQLIVINDTAGGVREDDLRLLVAPGASANSPTGETIGVFGVGSKRAAVALAEQIAIKTRYKSGKSFQVDITSEWLKSPHWDLPWYEIPSIDAESTRVELSSLRKHIEPDTEARMVAHLGEVYAHFLERKGFTLSIGGTRVQPIRFDRWAYPPGQEPRRAALGVNIKEEGSVRIEITAGLVVDRDPALDNYGVYFYCNDRLIAKEVRTRDVGYFVTTEAGVPHPDASLCRAIVRINGPAQLMPWNSSKSGINYGHEIFRALRPTLIQLVAHFSSLSRRLKDDWPNEVYRHKKGSVVPVQPIELDAGQKLNLPVLPRVNKSQIESLKAENVTQLDEQPWTLGLVEAVAAVEVVGRQRFQTRNRIALILLDSTFEIALKEFIVHRVDHFPPKQYSDVKIGELFARRHLVVDAVARAVPAIQPHLPKVKHYYDMRNKLIHERATVGVTDADVETYRETIERILGLLFGLRF